MKRVYFVRHGETEGNVNRRVQSLHDPLTHEGRQQALKIAERACSINFDVLYTSDALRAKETSAEIAQATGKELIIDPLFREFKRPSSMEGEPRESNRFQGYIREEIENIGNPEWSFEDSETFYTALERVKKIILLLESSPEENIMVVTHGHLLRLITAFLLHKKDLLPEAWRSVSYTLLMSNAGLTVWQYEYDLWQMLTWNDHAHFAE